MTPCTQSHPLNDHLVREVLQVAGYHVTSRSTFRRHHKLLTVLAETVETVELKAQVSAVLTKLQDRWGYQSADGEKSFDIRPMMIADWLATRHDPARTLKTLQLAAEALLNGETSISKVQSQSFNVRGEQLALPVRTDTFREWLLRTGVARREALGVYRPGVHAKRVLTMCPVIMSSAVRDIRARRTAERRPARSG